MTNKFSSPLLTKELLIILFLITLKHSTTTLKIKEDRFGDIITDSSLMPAAPIKKKREE